MPEAPEPQILAGYLVLVTILLPGVNRACRRDRDNDHVLACATATQTRLIVSAVSGYPVLASVEALQYLDTQQRNF